MNIALCLWFVDIILGVRLGRGVVVGAGGVMVHPGPVCPRPADAGALP